MARIVKSERVEKTRRAVRDSHPGDTVTCDAMDPSISTPETLSAAEESDDEAPEAVSMSATKADIMTQIKTQREVQRQDKERRRKRALLLQEQSRAVKQRAAQKDAEDSAEDSKESEQPTTGASTKIAPLPQSILESALASRQVRFASSDDDEASSDEKQAAETERRHALALKRQMISALPFSVSEIGFQGRARLTRQEIKTRESIATARHALADASIRRIDAVLDRARKTRGPAQVFARRS